MKKIAVIMTLVLIFCFVLKTEASARGSRGTWTYERKMFFSIGITVLGWLCFVGFGPMFIGLGFIPGFDFTLAMAAGITFMVCGLPLGIVGIALSAFFYKQKRKGSMLNNNNLGLELLLHHQKVVQGSNLI